MEDLVNVTPENYLQVITALVARLKRVEQHLNLIEPEVEPEAAPLPVDPVLEVVEELKQPNDEAEKRFVQLRTHLLPFIDRHLKEDRGLFLDGSSARMVLHTLFQANSPGGTEISPEEKKRLSKWVTSSLKAWRRKDFLRLTKNAFHAHLVQTFGPDQKEWMVESIAQEAMDWVDSEVVMKYELGPMPPDGSPIVKSDLVLPNFKRFIVTIVHNLVPREANDYLPAYLQWKPADPNDAVEAQHPNEEDGLEHEEALEVDNQPMEMDEQVVEPAEEEEPRKRSAKRKTREEESEEDEPEIKRSRSNGKRS
jgi:hypothetical protein